VTSETIGHTYLNQSLKMFTISSNPNGTGKALLITGPHHSRELSAIQVPLFVILRIVQDWLHWDAWTVELLKEHKIYYVPIINLDGYKWISEQYIKSGVFNYKRKNMNRENEKVLPCEYEETGGIDLNRNYDWEFNSTLIPGSSDNPCSETYRGPYPFSEPET
jgi:carboxypeptidase T